MPLRRILRESVPDEDVGEIAREVARRQGGEYTGHQILDAQNWFSIPIVVSEEWFAKIVSPQHLHVHRLLTHVRNVSTASASVASDPHTHLFRQPMFDAHDDVLDMARHDREALEHIRRLDVPAPEPLDVFQSGDRAILVLEYLPNFTPLGDLAEAEILDLAPDLFRTLKCMHDAGMAHGDLHAENLLLASTDDGSDRIHIIDATRINPAAHRDARAYDLACALAAFAPLIGGDAAVEAARRTHSTRHLDRASRFLDYLRLRPQEFDAEGVKQALAD